MLKYCIELENDKITWVTIWCVCVHIQAAPLFFLQVTINAENASLTIKTFSITPDKPQS